MNFYDKKLLRLIYLYKFVIIFNFRDTMLFRSCCAFSLKLLFVGDVVEQMDAEHLLFLPLHWPENLRAGKIQKFN